MTREEARQVLIDRGEWGPNALLPTDPEATGIGTLDAICAAVAAERERCTKIAEDWLHGYMADRLTAVEVRGALRAIVHQIMEGW